MKRKKIFFSKQKDIQAEVEEELVKIRARQKEEEINKIIERLTQAYKTSEVDLLKFQNPENYKNEVCQKEYREIYEGIDAEQTNIVLSYLVNNYCENLIGTTKDGIHGGFTMQIDSLKFQKALAEYKKLIKDDSNLMQNYKEIEQKVKTDINFDNRFAIAKKLGTQQDEIFNSTNRAYLR